MVSMDLWGTTPVCIEEIPTMAFAVYMIIEKWNLSCALSDSGPRSRVIPAPYQNYLSVVC